MRHSSSKPDPHLLDSSWPDGGGSRYLPAIDGLRGLAVAAVLMFHQPYSFASGGFLGVSTFFTLSGFLIGRNLLGERRSTGSIDLRAFWERRARRLLPPAIACVLMILAHSLLVRSDPTLFSRLRWDLLSTLGYAANWRFLLSGDSYIDLFAAPSPVLHFWSLAIEEQFYVALPLLVLVLSRFLGREKRLTAALVAITGLAACWTVLLAWSGASPDRIYLGTDTRAAELLVGVALASLLDDSRSPTRRWTNVFGLAALLLTLTAYSVLDLSQVSWGVTTFFAFASAGVVAAASQPASLVSRLLTFEPLRLLGRISYGVYLYHWPIFRWTSDGLWGLEGAALFTVRCLLTVGVATASFHLLEMPVRERRIAPMRPAALAVGALSATLVLVLAGTALLPQSSIAVGKPLDDRPREPMVGRPVLLVAADRPHGEGLASALRTWAGTSSRAPLVRSALVDDCGIGTDHQKSVCPKWEEAWLEAVSRWRPTVVFLSMSDDALGRMSQDPAADPARSADAPARALGSISELADLLSSRGARVAVAPAVPELFSTRSPAILDGDVVLHSLANVHPEVTPIAFPGEIGVDVSGRTLSEHEWSAVVDLVGPRLSQLLDRTWEATTPTKVMIVGDSVASSVGTGLEAWARETGAAVVWNVALPGCGIARGGELVGVPELDDPPREICDSWGARWSEQIATFDPDVVVVHSGLWDLVDRKLPGTTSVASPGEPDFDRYLLSEYSKAVRLLSSAGARVVWLTSPCVGPIFPGPLHDNPALDPSRTRHLNEVILTSLVDDLADVRLVDLFGRVCPAGKFEMHLGPVTYARPDGLHFSPEGARWLADWLGPELVRSAKS